MTRSRIGVANINKQVSEEKEPMFAEVASEGDRLNSAIKQDPPLG